jgi:hypothetical protein
VIGLGSRVSYEDMANPRRVGTIVGEIHGQWAVRWDEDAAVYNLTEQHGVFFHATVTKHMLDRAARRQADNPERRVAGWNVVPGDVEWEVGYVPAMAPEELPRDEGVRVFVHDSEREVTLTAATVDEIVAYVVRYWGDDDEGWLADLRARAVPFPKTAKETA